MTIQNPTLQNLRKAAPGYTSDQLQTAVLRLLENNQPLTPENLKLEARRVPSDPWHFYVPISHPELFYKDQDGNTVLAKPSEKT